MLRRERPVAAFVVMILMIVASLLFALLGIVDYRAERARQQEQLRADVELLADQLASSLSVPMWNFDELQLKSIADGVMNDQDVYGVVIRYTDVTSPNSVKTHTRVRGDQWQAIAADTEGGADIRQGDSFAEQRDVIYAADGKGDPAKAAKVGTVTVYMTPRFMDEQLWRHVWHEILIFAGAGAVLTLSLYFLLWRTVLKPLNEIDDYAHEVSASEEGRKAERIKGGKPFRGELQRVRASIEKMVDLLEDRLAETRTSARQFRTFIEQAPVPITLVPSPDGSPIYFNPAFTRLFGYTAEDLRRPEDWWGLVYPDPAYREMRRAEWATKAAQVKESGGFRDTQEGEMRTKDGESCFVQARIAQVGPYRMSFFDDLTERRQVEMTLRLTQYAVDHNPSMIFQIDMDGRFVYANDAACERLECSRAQIQQLHVWDISTVTTEENWPLRAAHFREQGSAFFESYYVSFAGTRFPAEVRIQYLEFSGKKHFVVFAFDITVRKAAQDAEHAYTRRIQKLATELTRSEERQRREFATILHDEVGQNLFAATTQLLTIRNRVDGSQVEVEKALALLDKVTRDTRELTFELCPPVLYQLGLMPALQRLADQFTARHGIASTVTGTTLGPIDLNARGLAYQAVRELLNNAAKHSNAKTMTIDAAEVDGDVAITVIDDGVGFDPERVRPGNGGFGLFHLRERMELLGGNLSIESALGKGCRVQLRLPLNILTSVE